MQFGKQEIQSLPFAIRHLILHWLSIYPEEHIVVLNDLNHEVSAKQITKTYLHDPCIAYGYFEDDPSRKIYRFFALHVCLRQVLDIFGEDYELYKPLLQTSLYTGIYRLTIILHPEDINNRQIMSRCIRHMTQACKAVRHADIEIEYYNSLDIFPIPLTIWTEANEQVFWYTWPKKCQFTMKFRIGVQFDIDEQFYVDNIIPQLQKVFDRSAEYHSRRIKLLRCGLCKLAKFEKVKSEIQTVVEKCPHKIDYKVKSKPVSNAEKVAWKILDCIFTAINVVKTTMTVYDSISS